MPAAPPALLRTVTALRYVTPLREGGSMPALVEDAGAVATLPASERFGWLTAASSTIVRSSPIHTGLCDDPEPLLDRLFTRPVT